MNRLYESDVDGGCVYYREPKIILAISAFLSFFQYLEELDGGSDKYVFVVESHEAVEGVYEYGA